MPAMISIDFGNSYTKVAIRPDSESAAGLMKDPSLTLDELNVCVPTLAARLGGPSSGNWSYGTDVMRHSETTAGLTVFRNWKPDFFRGSEAGPTMAAARDPVPALSGAARQAFRDDEWAAMRDAHGFADADRPIIEAMRRPKPTLEPIPAAEETGEETRSIALGFFRWLREELVDPACKKVGLKSADGIPTRISLPSFGGATKAELLLCEILDEAGWTPDEKAPALAEPLANAIGTFTEGLNATHRPRQRVMPNYGRMFASTGLLQAMRKATLADGPKVAWAMIADLGGYTIDFAMVGLLLDDIDSRIEGEIDGKKRSAHTSKPLGVSALDERVRRELGPAKAEAFAAIASDPDQQRLKAFHSKVYGSLRPYSLGRRGTIGTGEEMHRIRDVVDDFAEEIAGYAEAFLEANQYDTIDDLILTGGGSMIPAVRKALRDRMSPYGWAKTHMYFEPAATLTARSHRLDERMLRGATALGGASVYFDFAD